MTSILLLYMEYGDSQRGAYIQYFKRGTTKITGIEILLATYLKKGV